MYSNNILNFQESMTILNACTKKVWKRIECTTYKRVDMVLKAEKCPMLNSGKIIRLTCMGSIRCYEYREESGVW